MLHIAKLTLTFFVLSSSWAPQANARQWTGKDGKHYESLIECSKKGTNEPCETKERVKKGGNVDNINSTATARKRAVETDEIRLPGSDYAYCSGKGTGKLKCYVNVGSCIAVHNDCRGMNIAVLNNGRKHTKV